MKRVCVSVVMAIALLSAASEADAQSRKSKAAAAGAMDGLARSLSTMAERQIALDSEIELMRARAAIELDLQRRLAADRKAVQEPTPPVQVQSRVDPVFQIEFDRLDRAYPAWFEHAETELFKNWLAGQSVQMKERFAKARRAEDLLGVLNEHRLSLSMEPIRLLP